MRVLCWHVHGTWHDAFVRGGHEYLLPVLNEGGQWGRGRAGRAWPENVRDVPVDELPGTAVDVVVLQRVEEIRLTERWLGRRPGIDLPAVYVEHNTPPGGASVSRHPLADRRDIPIVHVTDFNRLMWDCGTAPTTVIGHGIPDPGQRYLGDLPRAVAVVNEPVRRGRAAGADLLPAFCAAAPVDVFGIKAAELRLETGPSRHELLGGPDLPMGELHRAMARRRVYIHPARWTSLGLSLVEAMHLGMPVAVVASTAAATLPPEVGAVSADVDELVDRVAKLVADPGEAREAGAAAREYASIHFGLEDFLRRWDALLARATS
ncbi:glycosyltransferase [Glycomyces sp. TRM65418]|uniref:glycosyltransferase n=1 Tax=Glycomyces sp. TRM65418 TaxID=2867006 RepID=UPI0035ABFF97